MSYVKKTWASGDTVTSSALNNMETGIANAESYVLTITKVSNNYYADLTGAEINDLAESGRRVIAKYNNLLYEFAYFSSPYCYMAANPYTPYISYITINGDKKIGSGSYSCYTKPSSGIPETDLAQAVKDKLNTFVVTLTPTAQDYSGTMDKTVAEIQTAYDAGKSIVFRLVTGVADYTDIPLAFAAKISEATYMNFVAYAFISTMNLLIVAETWAVNDGTTQTYATTIYSLTPMS